jgi:hypothetical protein
VLLCPKELLKKLNRIVREGNNKEMRWEGKEKKEVKLYESNFTF